MGLGSLIGMGLAVVACLLVLGVLRNAIWRRNSSTSAQPRDWRDASTIQITASVSTRSYDPAAYRFDGLAEREWRIEYADANGEITVRDIYVHTWNSARDGAVIYDCWCFLRDDRRSFRQDRMLSIINLSTGRRIQDIRKYRTRY